MLEAQLKVLLDMQMQCHLRQVSLVKISYRYEKLQTKPTTPPSYWRPFFVILLRGLPLKGNQNNENVISPPTGQ